MLEDTDDLRAWARSRIEECRRQEVRFSRSRTSGRTVGDAAMEAATERRTLLAVLRMLDDANRGEEG